MFEAYIADISSLQDEDFLKPLCGHCLQAMNHHLDKVKGTSYYSCARKHPKIFISTDDLKSIVRTVFEELIEKLDISALKMDSIRFLNGIKRHIYIEIQKLDRQLEELEDSFLFDTEDYCDTWKERPIYQQLQQLRKEKQTLLNQLEEKECAMRENTEVVQLVEDYLEEQCNSNFISLCTLLICSIIVNPDFIDIKVSKMDYVRNMETEFIYEGGETV